MRAVNVVNKERIEIAEVPDPQPGPGQVRIKMRAVGICGSDLHHIEWSHPTPGIVRIPGHEPSGTVDMLGEGVSHLQIGERVSVNHIFGCNHCYYCVNDDRWWCENGRRSLGLPHGACSDYIVVDAVNCLPLPEEFSFAEGALLSCATGTAYSALNKLRPSGQETLVVVGLGPVGLAGVGLGHAMGAPVIAVGRRKDRLQLAKELGAEHVINIDEQDAMQGVRELLPRGSDLLLETVGSSEAHCQLPRMLSVGGRACLVGFHNDGGDPSLNLCEIINLHQTLTSSFVIGVGEYRPMVELMQRRSLHLDHMVTHRFSIEQAQEAFDTAFSKECGKVIFEWDD